MTAGAIATTLIAPSALAQTAAGQPAKAAASPAPESAPKSAPDKKTKDAARKAFEAGQKAFKAGNFAEAAESFQKANGILPTPHAEYWIGMSLAGQESTLNEAVEALQVFLSNPAKDKVGEQKVAEATAKLAELQAKQSGELQLSTDPKGATVSVDGVAQPGVTPLTLKLAPGKHKLEVAAMDYQPQTLEVEVTGGKKVESQLKLEPLLAPPPPAPAVAPPPPPVTQPKPAPAEAVAAPPPSARSNTPAYITLGLAGAGVVVGSIFGFQALSAKSDFNDNPTGKKADDVERNALISDMAFGVAVTLGLTGVVLLTSPETEDAGAAPTASKLEFTPYASTKGGGANARFTF
ncbi:MAG: PEGA domain-containing protein [Polyangiaceae bacterium]|nr:PEGA domain-containing protein [Polyangiaceae bacterium]